MNYFTYHRDYAHGTHSQIRLYDDRVEFWNSGGLPSTLTPEALFADHDSIPRNKKIAEVFYYMGFIERWGSGTVRVVEELKNAGLPMPEFISEPGRFKLIFYQPGIFDEQLKKLGLSEREMKAIAYIQAQGSISNSAYQKVTGASKRTATRELNDLVLKGVLTTAGGSRGKGKLYTLKKF